jgi:hypothetical protein
LAPEAALIVGSEASPEYALYIVNHAITLASGTIVAVNAQQELRVFDPQGRFVRAVGRRGQGPGEFTQLWTARVLPGDSVAAFNTYPPRIAIFDREWSLGRTINLKVQPFTVFSLEGGRWFGARARPLEPELTDIPDVVRRRFEPIIYGPDGEIVARLPPVPDAKFFGTRSSYNGAPFSPAAQLAAGTGRLFVADGEKYEVLVYSDTGELLRTIRNRMANERTTSEAIAVWKAQRDAARARGGRGERGARGAAAPRQAEPPFPDRMPAIDRLLLDAAGNLWVRRYRFDEQREQEWHVYDRDGKLAALCRVHAAFRITEIVSDQVLGVWRDSLDVETIRRFQLIRSGR